MGLVLSPVGQPRLAVLFMGGHLARQWLRRTATEARQGRAQQRWEDALGLYFYQARWYDPALGRFIQPDSIVPEPGNPQALNRYSYCLNNPVKYNDPSGHWLHVVAGGLIGAAVGAGFVAVPQIINNVRESQPLLANIDPVEVRNAAITGAVAGAVGTATFGVATAIMGTSLAGFVGEGAVSGVVSGQVSTATGNVLGGNNITEGLGDPKDLIKDAAIGGAMAGVAWGADHLIMSAKKGGTYSRYAAKGEVEAIQTTGKLRGGNPGKTYFTTDIYDTATKVESRLALGTTRRLALISESLINPRFMDPSVLSLGFGRFGTGMVSSIGPKIRLR